MDKSTFSQRWCKIFISVTISYFSNEHSEWQQHTYNTFRKRVTSVIQIESGKTEMLATYSIFETRSPGEGKPYSQEKLLEYLER